MEQVKKIVGDIKNGEVKPIYFLMGEEPYYIDSLAGYFEVLKKAFSAIIDNLGCRLNVNQIIIFEILTNFNMGFHTTLYE